MSTRDKLNILMVDDQPARLLTYEAILSDLEENLIKATSGREALEHLLKTEIAIVLVDVSMPVIDGFELAATIRQHPRYQKAAIIFVSAVCLTDLDRLKGYEVGAVDYIPVPVIPEILRAKVSVFAELYRKTRQLEELNQELERRVAERTAELQQLLALTDTALEYLALDDLLPALLERVQAVLSVDNVALLLLDADRQTLRVQAARGPEEAAAAQVVVPVGQGFAGRIAASRAPLIVEDLATFPVVNPFLAKRLRAAVGVPLLLDGHVLGVLHVGTTQPHTFSAHDVQLLQLVASRVALAIDRAQLFEVEQTERVEAEAALARAQVSESRYQRLMEANIIGIAVEDAERTVEANDAYLRLLGYTREDLVAGRLSRAAVTPPEYLAETQRILQEALTTGACEPMERKFVRQDGSWVPALVGTVLLEPDPVRFVSFVLDLSERERLQRDREAAHASELALREVNHQMDQLLATAAHDLRSPVTSATIGVELAQSCIRHLAVAVAPQSGSDRLPSQSNDTAVALDAMEHANQAVERLSRLISRLFDVALARTGKLELRPVACDLATLVCEYTEAQRALTPERSIRLDLPAGVEAPVVADADRIGQVVTNLLSNALKYSPADRPVDIELAVVERQVRVAVRDEGSGLPQEEQDRVWEAFHRVPGIEAQGGTRDSLGLGLYICKTIVEHHGGTVGVESVKGEGSTFWFTLPLAGPSVEMSGALHAIWETPRRYSGNAPDNPSCEPALTEERYVREAISRTRSRGDQARSGRRR
jgi:PAS domain S-box-containing protein